MSDEQTAQATEVEVPSDPTPPVAQKAVVPSGNPNAIAEVVGVGAFVNGTGAPYKPPLEGGN